MRQPTIVSRNEGAATRNRLLVKENLNRQRYALSARRRKLPRKEIAKEYVFQRLAPEGARMAMTTRLILATVTASLLGVSAPSGQAAETTIEQMPATLETRFALSALPPALRDRATVYLLDPEKGYHLSRQGTSGVTCLVERTVWEWVDFRNDIYIPLCYDAVGTKAHLRVIMDTATLRAQGLSPLALKAEIERRYQNRTYRAPVKAGLSYMVAPIMRAVGPPDMKVHTMSMPHLMFYAPHISNEDIGAMPDLSVRSSLLYPFIDKQGIAEQSYMIQLVGEAERARIMADEEALLSDLCAYRDVLCVPIDEAAPARRRLSNVSQRKG